MHDTEWNRPRVIRYLLWTFGLAYLIQFAAGYVHNNISPMIGQLIVAAMMFVPTLGVLLSGGKLRGMGWKPRIKKNLRSILFAWFAPAVLTAAGAGLYFLIFPGHFDLSGGYVAASAGEEALAQMEAQGLTYPLYVLVTTAASLTYAPLFNAFLALGEELGWRGLLFPALSGQA